MRKFKHRWPIVLAIIPAILILGFFIWGNTPLGPDTSALSALESNATIQVNTKPWLSFHPAMAKADTGLILYPGGRVDPRAYAPIARSIAEQGYLVVIVPMPLNLAVFGAERATEVIQAFPEIEMWAIGGHSLGGAMAARYAHQNPDVIRGLVLWASYPAENNDLSKRTDVVITSIYGMRDGLATVEKIDASRILLPSATRWVAIEGGNHAQFGRYGEQRGDNPATISAEEQQAQIVQATVWVLERLTGKVMRGIVNVTNHPLSMPQGG